MRISFFLRVIKQPERLIVLPRCKECARNWHNDKEKYSDSMEPVNDSDSYRTIKESQMKRRAELQLKELKR